MQRETVDDSICLFSIDKDQDEIKVSLNVFAEVKIVANEHKTACSIWKKTLFSKIQSEKENKSELIIANLVQEIIDDLSKDWLKANTNSKQLTFHINKFQDL